MKLELKIKHVVRIGTMVIIALLIMATIGFAQGGTWTPKKDMPTQRWTPSASVVNGKIYVIGGYSTDRVLSATEEYDPVTDTWKSKWNMITPRNTLATSVVNENIYAIGGQWVFPQKPVSTEEEYNSTNGRWTANKKDMRYARMALSASMVNGKIYAIGGWRDYIPIATVEVYDPATDEWDTDIPDIQTARWGLCACQVDGKICAMAGTIDTTGDAQWGPGLRTVEQYIPLSTGLENIYWNQKNPGKFLLHQNYFNPFNPQTMIEYQLPQTCHVRLVVYNLLGQEIATLLDQIKQAGQFNLVWDGKDSYGRVVPSGVYFYRLETENFSEMKSMILLE